MHDSFTVLAQRPQAHPLFQQPPQIVNVIEEELVDNRPPDDVAASPFKTSQLYTPISGSPYRTPAASKNNGGYGSMSSMTPLAPRKVQHCRQAFSSSSSGSLSANSSPLPGRRNGMFSPPSAIPSRLAVVVNEGISASGNNSVSSVSKASNRQPLLDLLA